MKVLTVPWLFFFQLLLDLKNVSSSSRQLRLTPPATKYFSVGLGRFPGEHGVVAPGLSCQYPIKFAPDSLADYDDIIKVIYQEMTTGIIFLCVISWLLIYIE